MKLRGFWKGLLLTVLTLAVAVGSVYHMAEPVRELFYGTGAVTLEHQDVTMNAKVMERYTMYMNNRLSSVMDGVVAIEKKYWLTDNDLVAPAPKQENYGTYANAAAMEPFLQDAQKLLAGQETFFTTTTNVHPQTKVLTYLDDTIMVITWKESIQNIMYTFSEVKIAHPSQFRRFLTGGTYGSDLRQTTSEMAANVNAVMASSGDFYSHRQWGICVYNGRVYRVNHYLDTCFVDDQGNLLFQKGFTIRTTEQAQKFVDENNIRFSLAFGPILIQDGEPVKTDSYIVGEIDKEHVRAALCQLDELHYLVVAANHDDRLMACLVPDDLSVFQRHLLSRGIQNAYCLDGGQTAVIVHNNQVINAVEFGAQRQISDIIYFATAMP